MKIEKDTVTFEAPDADFVTKFGIQAAADMVLDFHCFHPPLPFLYDAPLLCAAHGGSVLPRHHPRA